MVEHELLFLGLLKGGPKHGYEIKRLIEDELSVFIGVKVKSIYYPLKKMEKSGLIIKDKGRDGKRPEKYVYSLTVKGEEAFKDLISESFLAIERPFFDIDLSLYFLQYIDKKIAKRQLRGRVMYLKRISKQLRDYRSRKDGQKKHFAIILEHDLDLIEAEIASLNKLIKSNI